MKSIYSTIIGLMFCITLLAQEPVSEKFTVPLTRPGDRVSLKLDHLNGDIVISAYGGKEVIITATAKGGSFTIMTMTVMIVATRARFPQV